MEADHREKVKKLIELGCKQKALYVKCCVIQNEVADYHDDVLDSEDIKRIFTSFNSQDNFEVYHNEIPLESVSLLENYISTNDEVIAGTTVPKGSWNAVIRVDNPQIKKQLLNNDFGGVSLNNRVETRCSTGLEGAITYSDLRDAECVIPIFISFVDEPANKVGLHIMSYDVYIRKSKGREDSEMSLLEDLKALITKAEEESSTEDATIEKAEESDSEEADEEPVEEEATEEVAETTEEDVVVEKTVEEEKEEDEEPVIEKDADEDSESDDLTIEKAEDSVEEEIVEEADDVAEFNVEAEIKKLREELDAIWEIIAPIEEAVDENPIDETVTAEDTTDEPIITKSAKVNVVESAPSEMDFYERTGRDRITGKRIRKQSKILN